MSRARRTLLAAPALLFLQTAAPRPPASHGPALKAGVFDPPRPAPQIALPGTDGRAFNLARLRGKLVLLSFGYTQCPAVCPTTLATLAETRRRLGTAADRVQVVFVTVDPERDDLPQLGAYLAAFDPTFIGVTGPPDALAAVRRAYGVTATKVRSGSGYGIDHSASVQLVDAVGRLRALMPYGRPAQDYVHDVRQLLEIQ